jgi:hypothetical protein
LAADVSVDAVMTDVQGRVRERLRLHLVRHGAAAFEDPALFAEVERLLRASIEAGDSHALLVPELLGEPASWRLETAMKYGSHRPQTSAAAVQFVKRRILMSILRWLFEYSRDNFERQRRVNQALFACVQELALETARLRRELQQRPPRHTETS